MPPKSRGRRGVSDDVHDPDDDVENTPLWRCLRREDFVGAGRLVHDAVTADRTDAAFGWAPLLFAANAGDACFAHALLDKHGDLEVSCSEGNTALSMASRRGHVEIVNLLLSRRADLEAKNARGWGAMMWAAMSGQAEAAAALLAARADTNTIDSDGRNPCMWAARHGHEAVVAAIVASGFDLNIRDFHGMTAMDHASDHLELKAAMVLTEEHGRRLLDAAQRNDVNATRELLEEGAQCDARDDQGWTALTWAVLHASCDLASVLVQYGANPYLLGEDTELAERLAACHMDVGDKLQHILESNRRLLEAAKAGDWACVQAQLSLGAYVDATDGEKRRSALMWASRRADLEGIECLASRGATINLQDTGGYTAFLMAVLTGSCKAVALLCYWKADVTMTSYEGDSALHFAVRADSGTMIQTLLAARADSEEKDYKRNTPLHLAALTASCDALTTLLHYGADVAATDGDERTPLSSAVVHGQFTSCEAIFAELPELEPIPGLPPALKGPMGALPESDAAAPSGEPTKTDEAAAAAQQRSSGSQSPKAKAGRLRKGKRGLKVALAASAFMSNSGALARGDDDDTGESEGDPRLHVLREAAKRREEIMADPVRLRHAEMLAAADADGKMPLHLACEHDRLQIAHLLVQQKASIDVRDDRARTPLMEAVLGSYRQLVEEFLPYGPDLSLKDSDGLQAIDLATDEAIRAMLVKALVAQKIPKRRNGAGIQAQDEPVAKWLTPPGIFRVRAEELPKAVPKEVLASELRSILRSLGTRRPISLEVLCDPITDRPKGYAYIDFDDAEAADRAMLIEGKKVLDATVRAIRDRPALIVQ